MTFLDLARKNAWRKPLRTTLLIVCIAVAFLIHGLTASLLAGSQGVSAASDDILGVMSASGRGQPLPMAHRARIAADPDVAAVGYMTRLRGFVDVEKNVVPISAVDPALLMETNGTVGNSALRPICSRRSVKAATGSWSDGRSPKPKAGLLAKTSPSPPFRWRSRTAAATGAS